jgi:Transcriptional regulator, AbiEi antitoxin, Type IV TA system
MVNIVNIPRSEREVIRRILEELPRLWPSVMIEKVEEGRAAGDEGVDAIAKVRVGKLRKELVFEVKSSGEPRIAERAITQLRRLAKSRPNSYVVFAAPYISERSREICKSEGVGYIDLAGDTFLQFDSVLVDRVGKDSNSKEQRSLRSILAPKATRVLRALLQAPTQEATVSGLATTCEMSPAGVYLVAQLLEAKGYVSRGNNRTIVLREPGRLLRDWAENWTIERNKITRYFSFGRDSKEVISALAKASKDGGIEYALTGITGAYLVAPFVRSDEVWSYVGDGAAELIDALDLRPVSSGANIVLLDPYDKGVFQGAREIRGARVVSNIQLYVDLLTFPGRGREQAEHLLEKMGLPRSNP